MAPPKNSSPTAAKRPAATAPSGGHDAKRLKPSTATGAAAAAPHTSSSSSSLFPPSSSTRRPRDPRAPASQPSSAALSSAGELDVSAFLAARAFELSALGRGMAASRASRASRAFQQVPRGLRRRTASHNPARLPRRLRERAGREMRRDGTKKPGVKKGKKGGAGAGGDEERKTGEARKKRRMALRAMAARRRGAVRDRLARIVRGKKKKEQAVGEGGDTEDDEARKEPGQTTTPLTGAVVVSRLPRPKIRRNAINTGPVPSSRYRKRQLSKRWLPTHLWHAKRARMTAPGSPFWGFALPVTPAEKVRRPTHRAAGLGGAVAWDASYMSTIRLCGLEAGVEKVLRAVGADKPSIWDHRGRKWRDGARHWTGMLSRRTEEGRRDIAPTTIFWNARDATDDADGTSSEAADRQVFLRLHPSAFLELFDELVRLVKGLSPQPFVEDLRFEIGSIEVTGPASTEALMGILRPYPPSAPAQASSTTPSPLFPHAALFQSLSGLTNPASLPPGCLLSFCIQDPRLSPPKSFPTPPPSLSEEDEDAALSHTLAHWPGDASARASALFDRAARHSASHLPSQRALNRRREALSEAGVPLRPVQGVDPPIPVIVLATRAGTEPNGRAQGSWTLLLPWGCVAAAWYALMHTPLVGGQGGRSVRFGGLDEARQVALERRVPWFPADYPATDAGATWEAQERERRRLEWSRRPSGKRVKWETVPLGAGRRGEVGRGWACDFENVLGLDGETTDGTTREKAGGEEKGVNKSKVQKDPAKENGTDGPKQAEDATAPVAVDAPAALKQMRRMSKAAFAALLRPGNTTPAPPNAVVTVRLTCVTRGVALPCARVYRLPSAHKEAPDEAARPSPAGPRAAAKSSPTGPQDLRSRWLAQLPTRAGRLAAAEIHPHPTRFPAGADQEAKKALLAAALVGGPVLPCPRAPGEEDVDAAGHPPAPDARDLVGFVTTGAFSLAEGKGSAIATLAVERLVVQGMARGGEGDATDEGQTPEAKALAKENGRLDSLCIVRNAGEPVGWLARWEVVD